jgi:hypothetical protein
MRIFFRIVVVVVVFFGFGFILSACWSRERDLLFMLDYPHLLWLLLLNNVLSLSLMNSHEHADHLKIKTDFNGIYDISEPESFHPVFYVKHFF